MPVPKYNPKKEKGKVRQVEGVKYRSDGEKWNKVKKMSSPRGLKDDDTENIIKKLKSVEDELDILHDTLNEFEVTYTDHEYGETNYLSVEKASNIEHGNLSDYILRMSSDLGNIIEEIKSKNATDRYPRIPY